MIFAPLTQQLHALGRLLAALSEAQYVRPIAHLGHASIGAHTRHIIELLQCAVNGRTAGAIDYVNRERNMDLQNHKDIAQFALYQLENQMKAPDKAIQLVVESHEGVPQPPVKTTYYRELVYNTEHAIHHLALIKVALIDMQLDLVDDHFGVAASTIKYKTALGRAS